MPAVSKRQGFGKVLQLWNRMTAENQALPSASVAVEPTSPRLKPRTRSARTRTTGKNPNVNQLEARIATLETKLSELQTQNQQTTHSLSRENETLRGRNQLLCATNQMLSTHKRKAERELSEELTRKHKRVKRLERSANTKKMSDNESLAAVEERYNAQSAQLAVLSRDLALAIHQLVTRDETISSLTTKLRTQQMSMNALQKRFYASCKRTERAKMSLKQLRSEYKHLRTWNPKEQGQYSADARELARDLTYAGCSAGKVHLAVKSCARAFGISIRGNRFMSRRSVARAVDEGGKFGELQLGREILEAPGFIESSDGTTHRGITVESRHVTLLTPSYGPGADDSDKSTWITRTRFLEVAPALDHTGETQFQGSLEAAGRIADVYSRSPLAVRDNRTMDADDYYRKKMGEVKDHASDGKKAFALSAEHKKKIIIQDLGRAAMLEEDDVTTGRILLAVANLTDEDFREVGKISEAELADLPPDQRSKITQDVLAYKLGQDEFDSLSAEEQQNKCTHIFGGCCCHKDLNVVRYGYHAVQQVYEKHNLTPPVLLANKANSATIELGADASDSAAVQRAIESSSRGAIKLLELIGALFRHKDGERGYQDKAGIFIRERKEELYGIKDEEPYPDTSNTRYGCFTYASSDTVCFHGIFQELVELIINAKTKSGQQNHVEHNVLEGLNCPATLTELVALALYGLCVSWPYMKIVRSGTKEAPLDLLDLTALHRKLPDFCANIAANPLILFDPTTAPELLTIDGQPFSNLLLMRTIEQLRPHLPHLPIVTSAMFSGCQAGWIQFTPESRVGGTFDQLTRLQRSLLPKIPTTNDRNEGSLGSYRQYMDDHPNSTPQSFSNKIRWERNDTQAFIKKFCDAAVLKFVMREVRKDGSSGRRVRFRRAWLQLQQGKAEAALTRREKTAARKKAAADRVAATQLELDVAKINTLTSPQLKEQLAVYRDSLKDKTLLEMKWKDMSKVAERRKLVLEARERELARRSAANVPEALDTSGPPTECVVVDEFGYCPEEDDEWEDIDG